MTRGLASREPDPSSLPKSSSSSCNGTCCVCIQRHLRDHHLQAATRPPPSAQSEPDEFLFAIVTGIIYILDYLYRNIWVRLVGIYKAILCLLKIDQNTTRQREIDSSDTDGPQESQQPGPTTSTSTTQADSSVRKHDKAFSSQQHSLQRQGKLTRTGNTTAALPARKAASYGAVYEAVYKDVYKVVYEAVYTAMTPARDVNSGPVATVRSAIPVRPAVSIEPAPSVTSVASVKPAASVKPVASAKSVAPVEPVDPISTVKKNKKRKSATARPAGWVDPKVSLWLVELIWSPITNEAWLD